MAAQTRADAVRLLIVADDPLARAGLAGLLGQQPGCEVVGQAAAQADLVSEVDVAQPDAVLWDLGWNPTRELSRLADLAADLPPIVALLPADSESEGYVAAAWNAGARALLLRDADAGRMLAAAAGLARGLVVLDATLAGDLLAARGAGGNPPLAEDLTPRELEVLQLLAQGLPNKAIARRLGISDHTVKFHVNAILGKLGAQSRTEAAIRATRLGLVTL